MDTYEKFFYLVFASCLFTQRGVEHSALDRAIYVELRKVFNKDPAAFYAKVDKALALVADASVNSKAEVILQEAIVKGGLVEA